jgi:hypothetical protein
MDIGRLSVSWDVYGFDQWWYRWQAWMPRLWTACHRQIWVLNLGIVLVMYTRKQPWERDGSGPPWIIR